MRGEASKFGIHPQEFKEEKKMRIFWDINFEMRYHLKKYNKYRLLTYSVTHSQSANH